MRKLYALFTLILLMQPVLAQEFDIREFAADLSDLSAVRSAKQDVNGDPCALVKVITNIRGMQFEANQGITEAEHKDDGYWLYISPRERNIKLMATGYLSVEVPMPEPAKSNTVYKMVVATKGGVYVSDLVKINFRLNQTGVYVKMGDGAPVMTAGSTAVYEVSKGKHQFRFLKDGFKEQQITVDATEDKNMDISLEPGGMTQKLELSSFVLVESEPAGADIFLNDQKVGVAPFQSKMAPGKYTLRVQLNDYYPHIEQFTLEAGKTTAIPKVVLKPRFGFWQLTSVPNGAEVLLNGKSIGTTPIDRRKIGSGNHEITVRNALYHDHKERFTVDDNEEKKLTATLKPAFGELVITSEPSGAKVFVDEREAGKTPYRVPRQPSGTYNVRLSYELYSDARETVTVADGKTTEKFMALLKNFGTVNITAPESDIYINGKKSGNGSYKANLPAGQYALKATRNKHHDAQKEILIMVGQTETVNLTPTPRMGAVSIMTHPFEASGADIYVNNRIQTTKTPSSIKLLEGDYNVTVKKSGYVEATKNISIREGVEQDLKFTLQTYKGSLIQTANRQKWQKYLWATGTVAAVGTGVYFQLSAQKLGNDYKTATWEAQEIYDKRNLHQQFSYIAFGAAVPLATMTIIKHIQYKKTLNKVSLTAFPMKQGVGVGLTCNF